MSKDRNSRFNTDILKETDENGDVISKWCMSGKSPQEAVCIICNHVINCSQHGATAVKRHSSSKKHRDACSKLRDANNGVLKVSQSRLQFHEPTEVVLSHSDKVIRSEIYFAFSITECDIPYTYSNVMTKLFPKMFTDSKVASDFKMHRSKLSYTISDGIYPQIKKELIDDIIKSQAFYTIQVDETPLSEKRVNQFDVIIRYFSNSDKQITVHHLESFFIGHAKAEDLYKAIESSLADLPSQNLLCFFSDGPNVMKSTKNKIISNLNKNLVDIGECSLHKVHNAFGHGINAFDEGEMELLLIDLYYFFKRSAVQFEDFKKEQASLGLPEHVFIRHVNNRWLTLHASVKRFIEQFKAIKEFFNKNLSSRNEGIRLKRIKSALSDKDVLAKALFLNNVGELFTGFLLLFQREEPLVHVLLDELVSLTKKLMGRFLKQEAFINKTASDLKCMDINKGEIWLKYPEIGLDTQKELLKNSKDKNSSCGFYKAARAFYISCTKSLLRSLPLDNKILENLQCLHPLYRMEDISVKAIRMLAAEIPNVIPPNEVSSLTDEWILLQSLDLDFSSTKSNDKPVLSDSDDFSDTERDLQTTFSEFIRIDHYWQKIFNIQDSYGKPKFTKLPRLVKALLSLAHGNAECERGFSCNKNILDGRSQLNIQSINGIRQMKSHVKRVGSIENIKIDRQLIKSVRSASMRYKERIENTRKAEKRKKEERENHDEVDRLKKEYDELNKKLNASQEMLQKAHNMISNGLKKDSKIDIESGQVLLKESSDNIAKYLKKIEENRNFQQNIQATKKNK